MQKDTVATSKYRQPFTFDRFVRILIGVAIAVCVILLIHRLSDVLLPFFAAWLIAFILEPVVMLNARMLRTRRRLLPVVLTLIELAVVGGGIGYFIVTSVISEIEQADKIFAAYYNDSGIIPQAVRAFIDEHVNLDYISQQISDESWQTIFGTLGHFVSGSVSVIASCLGWFVTALYLFFLMLDYHKIYRGIKGMVPNRYKPTVFAILGYVKQSIGQYFRGQSLIASIVGILFAIGFVIIKLPMAVAFGLFIGILNMVPYLQLASLPIATLLCLVGATQTGTPFWPYWWQCILVYCVVQAIQDLVITPRVMGKAMNLNPAIIFLSLSIWGSLLGFVGLIIALPLTALVIAIYKEYVLKFYNGPDIPAPQAVTIDEMPAADEAHASPEASSAIENDNQQTPSDNEE